VSFVEALRTWSAAERSSDVTIRFEESPIEQPKRSAWVVLERLAAIGQLTIWSTGECDAMAETVGGETLANRTRTLDTPAEVAVEADALLALVYRSSG
jgi:hypothetical protein